TMTRGPSSSSSSSPAGGSTSPATVLNVQPEKPQHYTYLKEFRTEQCPLFVQHKCTQHRPFSCFHWHFLNQRRRRPIRRRDGTFNYSPDIYCTKYDEGTGTCSDGDECPFLHRTAGDTERRYHLRYYKTGSCIHETDAKGHCSKNGSHCAFAHGSHDLRSPVYDIREVQVMESQGGVGATEGDGQSGQAASTALIEKIVSEEPRWQDHNYVLSHYKTELCKKPPRLCRQGYACPYYHNSKDRRRSPHKHKYRCFGITSVVFILLQMHFNSSFAVRCFHRALPCPAVKQSEEWGDPSKCEGAEVCQYCHTRTEQQFHPEIYKSTKCNDMQQCGSCPRGPFCAFAHIESKLLWYRSNPFIVARLHCEMDDLHETVFYLYSKLLPEPLVSEEPPFPAPSSPPPSRPPEPVFAPDVSLSPSKHSAGPVSASQCAPELFSVSGGSCAEEQGLLGSVLSFCEDASGGAEPPSPWVGDGGYCRAPGFEREDQLYFQAKQRCFALEHRNREMASTQSKQDLLVCLPVGSPLSLSSSIPSSLAATPPSPAPLGTPGSGISSGMNINALPFYPTSETVESVVGGSQFQSSAPVNIPGSFSTSAPFSSPSPSPPIRPHTSPFFSSHLSQPSQSENTFLGPSHSSLGLNGMSPNIWEHFPSGQGSPGTPPTLLASGPCTESSRLRQELEEAHRALKQWGHSWRHTAQSWTALKADAEESRAHAARLTMEAERARHAEEEAQRKASLLQEALENLRSGDNPHLALHQLQLLHRLPLESVLSLQAQLCSCLQAVEQVVYRKQRQCCVTCGEQGSVSLPCGHGLQCDSCSKSTECPLCS
ncbi:unnamed protein product, partial [Tetraodon nigroviridis]